MDMDKSMKIALATFTAATVGAFGLAYKVWRRDEKERKENEEKQR